MLGKNKKTRDGLIIGLGLAPTATVFLLLPSDLYIIGLIVLIFANLIFLAVLVPSAIALQQQEDRQTELIWVLGRPDQN